MVVSETAWTGLLFLTVTRLDDFQVFIGHAMPSALDIPSSQADTQLCYTHTSPITVGGETYTIVCDIPGSVVSVMIPGLSRRLTLCEVKVFGKTCVSNVDKF